MHKRFNQCFLKVTVMTKKIILFALALTLLCALFAGCSANATENTQTHSAASESQVPDCCKADT